MPVQFKDILSIIVIFQLLLLAVFLFLHRKGKRVSNMLLGAFFLSVCLNFTDGILILNYAYKGYPELAFIGNNFSLLFGPLLYLYAKSVVYKDFKLRAGALLHAIPFFVFALFSVFTYHMQPTDMKRFILDAAGKQHIPAVLYVIGVLLYVQFYSYTFVALRLVSKYKQAISNRFSEINKINLDWLKSTIILFMVVIGIGMLNSFISLTPLTKYFSVTLTVIIVTIFLFISRVLFRALQQPTIFEGIKEKEPEELPADEPPVVETVAAKPVKYATSLLTEEEKAQLKGRVLHYMQKEKPYLEPQLTLEELADMLKLKPKIISQVINECLNQNFFDFINRYRIEEAKRLLTNPVDKKITVLEVLYEVGFNSKSSFNTLFKKYTGLTPSEFKKANTPA